MENLKNYYSYSDTTDDDNSDDESHGTEKVSFKQQNQTSNASSHSAVKKSWISSSNMPIQLKTLEKNSYPMSSGDLAVKPNIRLKTKNQESVAQFPESRVETVQIKMEPRSPSPEERDPIMPDPENEASGGFELKTIHFKQEEQESVVNSLSSEIQAEKVQIKLEIPSPSPEETGVAITPVREKETFNSQAVINCQERSPLRPFPSNHVDAINKSPVLEGLNESNADNLSMRSKRRNNKPPYDPQTLEDKRPKNLSRSTKTTSSSRSRHSSPQPSSRIDRGNIRHRDKTLNTETAKNIPSRPSSKRPCSSLYSDRERSPKNLKRPPKNLKYKFFNALKYKARHQRKTHPVEKSLYICEVKSFITRESLVEYFKTFGKLVDLNIIERHLQNGKISKNLYGFVHFAESKSVDKVQANRPHALEGHLFVTKRCLPLQEQYIPLASYQTPWLIADKLSIRIRKLDLQEYFSRFGTILCILMGNGYADILFDDYDSVDKALVQKSHIILNRRIYVGKSQKFTRQQELAKQKPVSPLKNQRQVRRDETTKHSVNNPQIGFLVTNRPSSSRISTLPSSQSTSSVFKKQAMSYDEHTMTASTTPEMTNSADLKRKSRDNTKSDHSAKHKSSKHRETSRGSRKDQDRYRKTKRDYTHEDEMNDYCSRHHSSSRRSSSGSRKDQDRYRKTKRRYTHEDEMNEYQDENYSRHHSSSRRSSIGSRKDQDCYRKTKRHYTHEDEMNNYQDKNYCRHHSSSRRSSKRCSSSYDKNWDQSSECSDRHCHQSRKRPHSPISCRKHSNDRHDKKAKIHDHYSHKSYRKDQSQKVKSPKHTATKNRAQCHSSGVNSSGTNFDQALDKEIELFLSKCRQQNDVDNDSQESQKPDQQSPRNSRKRQKSSSESPLDDQKTQYHEQNSNASTSSGSTVEIERKLKTVINVCKMLLMKNSSKDNKVWWR